MNVKAFLGQAKFYKLSWEQLSNLAFCLGVEHAQLLAAFDDMLLPRHEWVKYLFEMDLINQGQHDLLKERLSRHPRK